MATTLYQAARKSAPFSLNDTGSNLTYEDLTDTGEVARGLRSSLLGTSANSFMSDSYQAAAAGDLAGAQAAKARAEQLALESEQYAPRVRSLSDIHGGGDAVDWAAGVAGTLPTTLVPAMAGGLIGGGLGGALRGGLGATLGGQLGAGAALYPQLRDAARMQQGQAEARGAPALPAQQVLDDTAQQGAWQSGIEALVPGLAARSVLGAGARVVGNPLVAGAKRVGRDIALDSGAAAVSEGVAMNYETGRDANRDTSGDNMRYLDAAAGEAIGGGVMGAMGAAGDLAHSALGTTLDGAGQAGSYAARMAKQGGAQMAGRAREMWDNRPGSLQEAAQAVGEGAADLQGKAEDAITRVVQRGKDTDVDELLAPVDNSSEAALRAGDAKKHTAATNMIAKIAANPGAAPDYVRAAAEQYAAGNRSQDSWTPVAEAVQNWKRGTGLGDAFTQFTEQTGIKLGNLAADARNALDEGRDAYTVQRDAQGRANAQTPGMRELADSLRDELSPLIDEALTPYTGLTSPQEIEHRVPLLTHGMRAWIKQGFSVTKGREEVPASLLTMFADAPGAVAAVTELMYKQGEIDDTTYAKLPLVQERLEVARNARMDAGSVVDEYLLPTRAQGLTAEDHDRIGADLLERLKVDKVSTAEAKALFGPRARLALDTLRAKVPELNNLDAQDDEASNGAERSVGATYDEFGEIKENAGEGMGFEDMAQITDNAKDPNTVAQSTQYHPYRQANSKNPAEPYKVGGTVKNKDVIDKETGEITPTPDTLLDDKAETSRADLQAKNSSTVNRIGYVDYLRELHDVGTGKLRDDRGEDGLPHKDGDFMLAVTDMFKRKEGEIRAIMRANEEAYQKMVDSYTGPDKKGYKARLKKPPSDFEVLNQHWYMLKEDLQGAKGEATNVRADEFKNVGEKSPWGERRDGEYGTTKHGRIWLERVEADGSKTQFATSTSRVVNRMSTARKSDGRVDESGQLAGQITLLNQGLASLLSTTHPDTAAGDTIWGPSTQHQGVESLWAAKPARSGAPVLSGRVGVKEDPNGPVRWLKPGEDFPDSLRMHSSSGQTYKDAKAARTRLRNSKLADDARDMVKKLKDRAAERDDGKLRNDEATFVSDVAAALAAKDAAALTETLRSWDTKRDMLRYEADESPLITNADGPAVMRNEGQRTPPEVTKGDDGVWDLDSKVKGTAERMVKKTMSMHATRAEALAAIKQLNDAGDRHEMRATSLGPKKWAVIADVPQRKGYAAPDGEISEMGKTSNFRSRQEDGDDDSVRTNDELTKEVLHDEKAFTNDVAARAAARAAAAKAKAEAAKPTPVAAPVADQSAATLKQTAFLLAALRKGVPHFNEMFTKADKGQQIAMHGRLSLMAKATASDAMWGGSPPSDMAAFKTRAASILSNLDKYFTQSTPAARTAKTEAKVEVPAINVWYSSGENPLLSNLAGRPFTYDNRPFKSVEHAYQSLKSGEFDASTYGRYYKAGIKIPGRLGTKSDGGWNITLMEKLVKASFEQNPAAAKKLLSTGDARITHDQDKGVWAKEFPRILEKVRADLQNPSGTKAPSNKLAALLKKQNDYLDNPPADYNTKQVSSIVAWATAQVQRLAEAKKEHDEGSDRWDELDDLHLEAKLLKLKAEKALANEAEVAAHEAEQGGPRYNAMATRIHTDLERGGFAATHDSPIRHEGKFDWRAHIGKGEGNASFGAGTYLSTADGVHRSYKRQFTATASAEVASADTIKTLKHELALAEGHRDSAIERRDQHAELIRNGEKMADEKNWQKTPEGLVYDDRYVQDGEQAGDTYLLGKGSKGYWFEINEQMMPGKYATLQEALDSFKAGESDHRALRNAEEAITRYTRVAGRAKKALDDYAASTAKKGLGADKSPTYEVSVDIAPEQLLNWNAPFNEQSQSVQEKLHTAGFAPKPRSGPTAALEWDRDDGAYISYDDESKTEFSISQFDSGAYELTVDGRDYGIYTSVRLAKDAAYAYVEALNNASGETIYHSIVDAKGSQAKASDYLQSLGILGHRYDSEAGQNDTHPNYVIYDDSKITTNYVHFNKQQATSTAEPASEAEQAKFFADVTRRLGPQMKAGLVEVLVGKGAKGKDIYLSGKWEKGAIYASVYARNLGQVGAHEAFHEFFSRLSAEPAAKPVLDILARAANSPYITRQLERLLDGETAALAQIKAGAKHSLEERMAYMFQFHQAGVLKIGPDTENIFTKLANFFRKVSGLINNDQKADAILRAFDRGEMQTADAAARVLAKNIEARGEAIRSVNRALVPVVDKLSRAVNTTETNLERRHSPTLHHIRRLFKRSVGESGGQGFLDAKDHQMKLWSNRLMDVFEGVDPKDLALAAPYLYSGKVPTDKVVRALVARLQNKKDGLLPAMHKYMRDAGVSRWQPDPEQPGKGSWVPMGEIKDKYFPRAFDTALILKEMDGFLGDMLKYNKAELEAIAAEQNAALMQAGGKDDVPYTAEDVAKGIANRMVNAMGQAELDETSSEVGFSPFMRAVNRRTLDWLAPEILEKYGDKDLANVMTGYIAQAVKRAEYTKRFGNGGEKLRDMLSTAHTEDLDALAEQEFGANAKGIYSTTKGEDKVDQRRVIEAALTTAGKTNVKERLNKLEIKALKHAQSAAKDVMGLEGTLGYNIDPKMRQVQNTLLVYENMRLLSTSLFSQFIDPLGQVVRGGTVSDAWRAYKRGLREVVASIKGDPIKDLDQQIADQVGTTDVNGFLAAFGQLQSSQYMGEKARKFNDRLFKYNGMEGFNRGMQVSATRTAINFIKRHAQQPNKDSAAYLAELNLKAADVKVDAQGELDYTNPRIQRALHQWVNGAILRPNAAQRPAWGSDPHYMVFWHMKQFAYTFHDVILKRAMYNYKQYGDMGPAGVLVAGYIPVMLASDAIKGVITTLGDEPSWMNQDLGDQIQRGAERAGLAGKFQPLLDVASPHRTVLGLGGPAVEQLEGMLRDPLGETLINALPGSNVLNAMGVEVLEPRPMAKG